MSRRKRKHTGKNGLDRVQNRPEPFPVREYAINPVRTIGSYIDYAVPSDQQCSWDNCSDKAMHDGYCWTHYQQLRSER